MKAIILLSALFVASCSKSKVDHADPIQLTAGVAKYQAANNSYYWRVAISLSRAVESPGNAVIEWDEYSANTLIGHKTQAISFTGATSIETMQSTLYVYTARNIKITSASIPGYQVTY